MKDEKKSIGDTDATVRTSGFKKLEQLRMGLHAGLLLRVFVTAANYHWSIIWAFVLRWSAAGQKLSDG